MMRDMNTLMLKEQITDSDLNLIRQNESMKNLTKDLIMNKKALDESSVVMSAYSREGGNSFV